MKPSSSPVRKALLQDEKAGKVRCGTCERRCLLVEGGTGWCRTRVNRQGVLCALNYGLVSSLSANPIEKKPLYHFFPGSRALTAGSWSCNFGCPWCQNWDISKAPPPQDGNFLSPDAFVEKAKDLGCQGTSISFNEPTLSLEWSLDVFRLAKERGLYNTYVTNGYMTSRALELLVEAGLDAMNVDIKGGVPEVRKYCKGVKVEKVWDRCVQAQALGLHLELTTLVIPTVNDGDKDLAAIAGKIVGALGDEIAWHVSGYYPSYRFRAPPTTVYTLERAYQIGKQAGLRYVYIGNVPLHPYDDTRCPDCDVLLIERSGFSIVHYVVDQGRCSQCGLAIAGVGWDWRRNDNPTP